MSAPAALEVRNLTITARDDRRRSIDLVDDVTLALRPGEVTGIVGETGAGKTVTARALLGLLPPGLTTRGEMCLDGHDVVDLADLAGCARLRGRRMGIVLQNPFGAFDPLVRIGKQLAEGVVAARQLSKADARVRAATLLEAMGFTDAREVLDMYPHELSGGMRQRVAIAMAMMPEPGVLIADEPTSALDAHLRVGLLMLLRDLAAERGVSVLMISHDLGLVGRFCDAIAVMYAGRLVEQGPAATVLAHPAHPYTAALAAAAPKVTDRARHLLPTIAGTLPSPGSRPAGCAFWPRCPRADERCQSDVPELSEYAAGSSVACHHPIVGAGA